MLKESEVEEVAPGLCPLRVVTIYNSLTIKI